MKYKSHFACFNCRKSFKYDGPTFAPLLSGEHKCPECSNLLIWMGHDFHTPRKQAKNQWKKLEILVEQGFKFHSCGCDGPGKRPKTLASAKHSWWRQTEPGRNRGKQKSFSRYFI